MPKGGFAAGEGADSLTPLDRGRRKSSKGCTTHGKRKSCARVAWRNADLAVYYFGIEKNGNLPPSLDPGGAFAERNLIWPHVSDAEAMKRFSPDEGTVSGDSSRKRPDGLQLVRSHRPAAEARRQRRHGDERADDLRARARRDGVWRRSLHLCCTGVDALAGCRHVEFEDGEVAAVLRRRSARRGLCVHGAGTLDVYEATYAMRWLERAIETQQKMDDALWDGQTLRYASGSSNVPAALRELVPDRDADLPAANSVAAMNLLRIATLTGSAPARTKADAIFRSYAAQMNSAPTTLPALASALAASASPAREVIILGNPANDDAKALLRVVRETFAPIRSLVVANTEAERAKIAGYVPLIQEMKPVGDKATAYVCVGTQCKSPVIDPAKLAAILSE